MWHENPFTSFYHSSGLRRLTSNAAGVHDSNAARSAVAENYIKTCNSLWITADIQRAVNAKAAKQLLGDSFKRQLKYDGNLSAVTFVCTKADDILTSEVQNSLNIQDELDDYWAQIKLLNSRRENLTLQVATLKEEKSSLDEHLEGLDISSEHWEELQDKLGDGDPIYRTPEIGKKRKRWTIPEEPRDAGESMEHCLLDVVDTGLGDASNRESSQNSQVIGTPLSEADIEHKLATIKTKKKEVRKSKKRLDKEISAFEQELAEATAEEAEMQTEATWLCIQGRSQYVKDAIKRDFALGIKE